jgi:FdhD protein
MKDLYLRASGYRASRGIHGAALADPERLLFMAEDVGRHNAVDKMVGRPCWPAQRSGTASS